MNQLKSVDSYILSFPEDVQRNLQKIRNTVKNLLPKATETISYGIPTVKLNGKNVVHYAAFKNHYSFFPTASGVEAFKKELLMYEVSKGTIQFPKDKPIPFDLISKITVFRKEQIERVNK